MELSIQNCTGAHYQTARRKKLKMAAKNLVVNWCYLIMWTKPPWVLLLHLQRHRPLLLNTAQVLWLRHVIFILRREGDWGDDTWLYGAHDQTAGDNYSEDGSKKIVKSLSFLKMWTKPPLLLHFLPRIWGLLQISCLRDCSGRTPRWWHY